MEITARPRLETILGAEKAKDFETKFGPHVAKRFAGLFRLADGSYEVSRQEDIRLAFLRVFNMCTQSGAIHVADGLLDSAMKMAHVSRADFITAVCDPAHEVYTKYRSWGPNMFDFLLRLSRASRPESSRSLLVLHVRDTLRASASLHDFNAGVGRNGLAIGRLARSDLTEDMRKSQDSVSLESELS